jgi:hypothetical protein
LDDTISKSEPTEPIGQNLCGSEARAIMDLEVGEAPALVQLGEVARELHGVRLVDPDAGGGGFGRRRAGFLA